MGRKGTNLEGQLHAQDKLEAEKFRFWCVKDVQSVRPWIRVTAELGRVENDVCLNSSYFLNNTVYSQVMAGSFQHDFVSVIPEPV